VAVDEAKPKAGLEDVVAATTSSRPALDFGSSTAMAGSYRRQKSGGRSRREKAEGRRQKGKGKRQKAKGKR
jgi:hypothetical protein